MAAADRQIWWGSHRRLYNVWLVGAGAVAFLSYCAIVWTGCPEVDEFEITAFTIAFQAVGYLIAMLLANICYSLGPMSERMLLPRNPFLYRKITFWLGVAFSVALPLTVPALALISVPRCH
ncbi:MAG TPA: hypothetical protein VHZ32_17760 [Rhizomicrobium sp.]|nr:hypothetical protein [Rhizomicrobium sp.]